MTTGTIVHFRCQHCGEPNEARRRMVSVDWYNEVRDLMREAAGDEVVLLPVSTLDMLGEAAIRGMRREGLI